MVIFLKFMIVMFSFWEYLPDGSIQKKPIMPTSIMEMVNSEIGPFGKVLKRQKPINHESTKIKILDYFTIFRTLNQAKNTNYNPRWGEVPFTLPVLDYLEDEDDFFSTLH